MSPAQRIMYVGDRDTYNDVFCQECGNIADKENLNEWGLCEECNLTLMVNCLQELQKRYTVVMKPEPNFSIELRTDHFRLVTMFSNWLDVRNFLEAHHATN